LAVQGNHKEKIMQTLAKKQLNDWIEIGTLDDIPRQGARVVKCADGDIAVFRTLDDTLFALRACPLHDWKINLDTGLAVAPDEGCAARFPVRVEGGMIFLSLVADEGCPNK
jgi:nitrite reductase (NADH) small subunit